MRRRVLQGSPAGLKNREVAEDMNRQANVMLNKYCSVADEIFNDVKAGFGQ